VLAGKFSLQTTCLIVVCVYFKRHLLVLKLLQLLAELLPKLCCKGRSRFPRVLAIIAVQFRSCKPQALRLLHAVVERKHCGNRYKLLTNVVLDSDDEHCSIAYNRFDILRVFLQSWR
jgi:hypothetical protein